MRKSNNNMSLLNKPNDLLMMGFDGVLGATVAPPAPLEEFSKSLIDTNQGFMLEAPTRQAPLSESNSDTEPESKSGGDDEVFTTEESSDKIFGMPKGIVIGVGIAILAIGGFLIYKKYKK